MAYMNQEKKQKIVEKVKPILKKYKMKATFAVSNHSTIVVNIKSGSLDFIGDMNPNRNDLLNPHKVDYEKLREKYTLDINPYWYQEHYTGKSKKFFSELFPALYSADYYDRSDIQTDYFDTAYYVDVNVGNWKQPYTITK